jgi:Zn finger protein HypA/HybF involved in hydrogenase expression
MHEATLARNVAKVLTSKGLTLPQVRLTVRGGNTDPARFDAELRAHLQAYLPDQARAVPGLEIRRIPFPHLCPGCGNEFESPQIAARCPACHGDSLPGVTEEEVAVERLERYP